MYLETRDQPVMITDVRVDAYDEPDPVDPMVAVFDGAFDGDDWLTVIPSPSRRELRIGRVLLVLIPIRRSTHCVRVRRSYHLYGFGWRR